MAHRPARMIGSVDSLDRLMTGLTEEQIGCALAYEVAGYAALPVIVACMRTHDPIIETWRARWCARHRVNLGVIRHLKVEHLPCGQVWVKARETEGRHEDKQAHDRPVDPGIRLQDRSVERLHE